MRGEVARVVTALKEASLLPPLEELVKRNFDTPTGRLDAVHITPGVIALINSPQEVMADFLVLRGQFNSYLDEILQQAKIFSELKEVGQVKAYMARDFVDHANPPSDRHPGPLKIFGHFYGWLCYSATFEPVQPEHRKPVLEALSIWERAMLDVILDPTAFYSHLEEGWHLGAAIGPTTMRHLLSGDSPFVKDGRYVDAVKSAIRHDDIVSGRIMDERTVFHQSSLLKLLYHAQSGTKQVPADFWVQVRKNPAFAETSYNLARLLKDADAADALFVQLINEQNIQGRDLEIAINHHFNDGAYGRFLHDPANDFKLVTGGIGSTSLTPPTIMRTLADGRIVVLTDYKSGTSEIGYAVIGSKVVRETGSPESLVGDVGAALRSLVAGFGSFATDYGAFVAKIKSGEIERKGFGEWEHVQAIKEVST